MKVRSQPARLSRTTARLFLGLMLLAAACVDDRLPTGLREQPSSAAVPATASAGEVRAYVTHLMSNTISVIRVADHSVLATIPVPNRPQHVALTPDGRFAYVTHFQSGVPLPAVNITVIRTADNTIVASVPKAAPGQTFNTATITKDGASVYVTNGVYLAANPETHIQVLRTSDNAVAATIAAGPHLMGAVTPDGSFIYMTGNSGVTVIRTSDNVVVTTISTASTPNRIVITPDGARAYVSHNSSDVITVINTSDNTILTTLSIPASLGLGIGASGEHLYVTNRYTNAPGTVTVMRTSDHAVAHVVPVGSEPQHVEVSPDGSLAYVMNTGDGTISVIRTVDHAVIATIPVSATPLFAAFAFVPGLLDGIPALQEAVDAVAAAGHLNGGQAKALGNHLVNALRALERGQNMPALAQLNAFIAQVAEFLANGVLTVSQADPLIAGAEAVIADLSAP